MPKFVTIGYGDKAGYERTDPTVRDQAHAHDTALQREGAFIGVAASPVQVRNPGASGVQTKTGSYLTSALPVAGFAIIEADDIEQAIEIVSKSPCAVADGVIEVWPILEREPT